MELHTCIAISKPPFSISYKDKLLLLGSCFAENIGQKLSDNKFNVTINPFGTLYNPCSIASAISILKNKKIYTATDLIYRDGLFHSMDHHSRFSAATESDCLQTINNQLQLAGQNLKDTNIVLITLGTRYVYQLKSSGQIAANCHKLPEKSFNRYPLETEEIAHKCRSIYLQLYEINPDIKIIFTVSPIRHWKDGAHNNQLSKASLLLAIDKIQQEYPTCIGYFPAYEIMMDELRDYRFYANDMIHPSALAIDYIWQRFTDTFINKDSILIMKEWQDILKSLRHKPFNPNSKEYHNFIMQTLLKIDRITGKFPYFDIAKEKESLMSKLN